MSSPYRKYDKEGGTDGFDWSLLGVNLGFYLVLIFGVIFSLGLAASVVHGCMQPEPAIPCKDQVIFIKTSGDDNRSCIFAESTMTDSEVEDKDGAFFNCLCPRP